MRNFIITLITAFSLFFVFSGSALAVSDPAADSAPASDITAFTVAKNGRGVAFTWVFTRPAPRATATLNICADTNRGRVCLAKDGLHVVHRGKSLQARTSRTANRLRVWVRAAHLGYAPNQTVSATAWVRFVSNTCTPVCTDTTTPQAVVKYTPPVSCNSKTGKWLNGSRRQKLIALTFDDGPHAATRSVLNALKTANVPATFYMNGIHVNSFRGDLRRMVSEGHELANHSYDHRALPSSSSLSRTNSVIRSVSGFKPCTFRPPYGAVNSSLVSRAGHLGLATIIWDIDTRDWESHNTSSIIRIGSSGTNGSIVLMHDGGGGNFATARAVPQIIANYKRRGFTFVTVDEMLNFQGR